MTLPASGNPISASQINTELRVASTNALALNDSAPRLLAGITTSGATIAYSNFYGKSNKTYSTFTTGLTSAMTSTQGVYSVYGYTDGVTVATNTVIAQTSVYGGATIVSFDSITAKLQWFNATRASIGFAVSFDDGVTYSALSYLDGANSGKVYDFPILSTPKTYPLTSPVDMSHIRVKMVMTALPGQSPVPYGTASIYFNYIEVKGTTYS